MGHLQAGLDPAPKSLAAQAEQALTAATAVAVASRPARRRAAVPMPAVADVDAAPARTVLAAADAPAAGKPARALPLPAQSEIITRPWPRSVLPHYGADAGLTPCESGRSIKIPIAGHPGLAYLVAHLSRNPLA